MDVYLLDANAISDLMMDIPAIREKVGGVAGQVVTSVIVRGEVRFGVERLPAGKRRNKLRTKAEWLFEAIPTFEITDPIADIYATTRRNAERRGLSCDDNDLWIAATALAWNAVLVSRDADVRRIPDLRVEDWTV